MQIQYFNKIILIICIFFAACSECPKPIKPNSAVVFVFLSVDCPLCQGYTLTLNQLVNNYDSMDILIHGVFSEKGLTSQQLKDFKSEYKVKFDCILDSLGSYKKKFSPSVTPEVFMTDNDTKRTIIYSGAIDNWAYETGKKRTRVTEHYLEDAINDYMNGREVKVKSVKAYGCIIE